MGARMSSHQPRDPDWQARCLASFERQPVARAFGISVVRVEPGFCEMRMPFHPELTQQNGYFHAGVVTTLADNAGGYAAYTLMPAGSDVLAVEFKVNLMAPAKGEVMIARGRVQKSGRTLTVCTVEVSVVENGVERDVALMQQTCMAVAAAK